jgi:hypothetical protein
LVAFARTISNSWPLTLYPSLLVFGLWLSYPSSALAFFTSSPIHPSSMSPTSKPTMDAKSLYLRSVGHPLLHDVDDQSPLPADTFMMMKPGFFLKDDEPAAPSPNPEVMAESFLLALQ